MVQASAAHQLRSPIQGKQVSGSGSSMWPVLVLGILTAIFAWIWYRGSEETKEPEAPVQKQEEVVDTAVTPERELQSAESKNSPQAAHLASGESKLNAADRNEPNSSEQEVPCLEIQEKTEICQARNEQQPKLQVKEKGLSNVDQIKKSLEVQSSATANTNIPLTLQEEACVTDQDSDAPTKGEHPIDLPRKEELQADIPEHLTDDPSKGELQDDEQKHATDVSQERELGADIQEQPVDVPKKEEPPTDIQEHLTDITKEEELHADLQEHPTDIPSKEELQGHTQERSTDVPKIGELQADTQEHSTDVQKKEELQADIKKEHVDVPKKKESPADMQEHLTDVPSKVELQANIQEQQTGVSVKENNLIEKHLKDLVQTNIEKSYKEISSKNDKVHSPKVNSHTSDTPEAVEVINGDEVYAPLKKEVQLSVAEGYPQAKVVDQAVVQSKGAGMLPTQTAEEPEAQKLDDSCHTSMSDLENGHGKEHPVNDSQDCVFGAKLTVENAPGCPLENSFVAKETINQDLYVEINTSSGDGNSTVTEQIMKHESGETCDIMGISMCSDTVQPSTSLQDNADIFVSSLNESSQEGLSNVQKLGTGPESSPVHIYNLMLTQEKEISGPNGSNTDEMSFCSPSEANINDIDYQKTRKIATIQPMPQNVNFTFKVHYITHSDSQIIAVTGDHEKLGEWETYVPLTHGNGGFWSHSITLPADTNLLWKFVMVENGKIKRWEECNNRFLKTAHDDIEDELCWGYP